MRMLFHRRQIWIGVLAKEEIFSWHDDDTALLKFRIELLCGNSEVTHQHPKENRAFSFVYRIIAACKITVYPCLRFFIFFFIKRADIFSFIFYEGSAFNEICGKSLPHASRSKRNY